LNFGLSTDFSVQLQLSLSENAQRKSKSKSEVAQCRHIHHASTNLPTQLLISSVE